MIKFDTDNGDKLKLYVPIDYVNSEDFISKKHLQHFIINNENFYGTKTTRRFIHKMIREFDL